MSSSTLLTDHFLIAMPNLQDSFFGQSLIYIFDHNEQGSMGLVIKKTSGLNLTNILQQLKPEHPVTTQCAAIDIYTGGPVQMEHGFVLHSNDKSYQQTANVGQLNLTTSRDILFAIADEDGPAQHLIALGYAGWGAGQLEEEIRQNTWLTCPAEHRIIFKHPAEQRREAAAATLGIQLSQLSSSAGNA